MEQKSIVVGAVLLIVGLGLGYLVWGNADTRAGSHMMPNGMTMSQDVDKHFIVQMIPHHEGAIAMAQTALRKSKRPEIISLANGIIEAQQKEINDMQGWYASWYGATPPAGGMGMMHMGSMEGDLTKLEAASGEDFDREFIMQMIPHHEMAIMMAQMLQVSTNREEMKELADNIITSQSREIDMMRSWLASWAN